MPRQGRSVTSHAAYLLLVNRSRFTFEGLYPLAGNPLLRRWPIISFSRLLAYSLMLVSPTVVALDALVFLRALNVDHAIWVVAGSMVSAVAVAWLFLGDMSGVIQYMGHMEDQAGHLPDLRTGVTRDLAKRVSQLDGRWRQRVDAFSRSLSADMQILESLTDPLILVDPRRRVVRANASARALFGRPLAGEAIDAALPIPDLLASVHAVLDLRTPLALEVRWAGFACRLFEARIIPIETSGAEDLYGEGAEAGVPPSIAAVVTLHETTETHRAAELRESFIANVSHELRTPLSVIVGFLETLLGLGDEDREAQHRFLRIMHDQASRMTRLVSDLLSLTRIDDDQESAPCEIVDIAAIIDEVARAMEMSAESRAMSIDVETVPDLDVAGDHDQLCQVVQNLLDNAVKYGSEGGRIGIAARRESDQVVISVSDDGDGIPPEHLPHLGERFYRVDRARSRANGGSGLGLAIVSGIIKRHRGTLSVTSSPGQGSTFSIRLPSRKLAA